MEQEQTKNTPEPKRSNGEPSKLNEYKPTIPYPQRLRKERQDLEYEKFMNHIKTLQINILFIEVVQRMPKYAKFMKKLIML